MGDIPVAAPSAEMEQPEAPHPSKTGTEAGLPTYEQDKPTAVEQGASPVSHQDPASAQHAFSSQFDMTSAPHQYGNQGPYGMGQMANALPQVNYRQGQYPQRGQQRHQPASSPPAVQHMQHMQHMPQYGGPHPMSMGQHGYYPQQPHMGQYYNPGPLSPIQGQPAMPPRESMGYYPNHMMNHTQPAYYYPQATQYPGQPQAGANNMMPGQYMPGNPASSDPRLSNKSPENAKSLSQLQGGQDEIGERGAVRGPPRKPRQSGHAIWIGNLPPQTDLMTLVLHVCKETQGLESLFLISKSNCAFANFNDENTSVTAQQKLHDSKFNSVRLVSRLRKSTVEGATGLTAPTGPAATTAGTSASVDHEHSNPPSEAGSASPVDSPSASSKINPTDDGTTPQDKFFILKSLTIEDLDLSVRTGIWATQSHNEEALNSAFKSADNVYLVFSANKSGEYFGYARMLSQINEDPAAAIEFAPKVQTTSELDLPKAIPTEATEHAPKGRIIDDSARGTIFWEADLEDAEVGEDDDSEDMSTKSPTAEEGVKTWGKPFKLEWLSANRLPFYRTRGLRNPWNSNREVKIARDGTELEPSAGRRLIGLFNRVQHPGQMPSGMRPAMGMMPVYPQMRPYGQ